MDTVSDNGVAVVGALDTSSSVELMDAPAVQAEGDAPTANNAVDAEMEEIRARMREMEEEAAILRQYHSEVENQMNLTNASTADITMEDKAEADGRSIYVGNVDYGATAEELESHFHGCGVVNRVTILCNKYTGQPKGFAYIEFGDKESMRNSLAMDDTFFRGRQIKVMAKRTNRPGLSTTNRFPRSRGRPRVIIKYVYGGSRRPRGYSRRRNFYSHF